MQAPGNPQQGQEPRMGTGATGELSLALRQLQEQPEGPRDVSAREAARRPPVGHQVPSAV